VIQTLAATVMEMEEMEMEEMEMEENNKTNDFFLKTSFF
jgi:hypothetical protein